MEGKEKSSSSLELPSGVLNLEGSPLTGQIHPFEEGAKRILEGKVTKVKHGLEDLNNQLQAQVANMLLCQAFGEIRGDLRSLIDLHSHHWRAVKALKTTIAEPTKTFFLDMKAKIYDFYSTFRLY